MNKCENYKITVYEMVAQHKLLSIRRIACILVRVYARGGRAPKSLGGHWGHFHYGFC